MTETIGKARFIEPMKPCELAAKTLTAHQTSLAEKTTQWVRTNYPERTKEYDKCTRDVGHLIKTLVYCLTDGTYAAMDQLSRMFFHRGKLQLKSYHVEFRAYDYLLDEIDTLFSQTEGIEAGAAGRCSTAIELLKRAMRGSVITNSDEIHVPSVDYETRSKHIIYSWDDEQEVMRNMQRCQRNWDLSKQIPKDAIDYLLWTAQNAPSKQYEGYYDVYYSTERNSIEELYQYAWGSTHTRKPPACWRNSQMNANMYMIFVCKQPSTMYNCNNDGTDQNHFGASRWENSIIQVGMAMALVMRAANKMGLRTGPNKVVDLGPDYNYEWEKKLGIYEEVKAGRQKLYYGLGIGIPNHNRPRWESDDYELALGASNGHNITVKSPNDPDWVPVNHKGEDKRRVKIVDIRDHAGETIEDYYGNKHLIPETHEIKINTPKHLARDIKIQRF